MNCRGGGEVVVGGGEVLGKAEGGKSPASRLLGGNVGGEAVGSSILGNGLYQTVFGVERARESINVCVYNWLANHP